MADDDATTTAGDPLPDSDAPNPSSSRRLITMIEHDGKEPPATWPDRAAEAAWAAISALWHPALLARVETLPAIQGVHAPTEPLPGELRLIVEGGGQHLPADYRSTCEARGVVLLDGEIDRAAIVRAVLAKLDADAEITDDPLALDFLALGSAHWWLRDTTIGMKHADVLDHEGLARETLAAARDWASGDLPSAKNRLRAAFETLTQARERFYPVDAYLVDLCLLDPGSPAGALSDPLAARAPFTLVGPAIAVERGEVRDPGGFAALREAITEGWADVAGGTYDEIDEGLAPVGSILHQFRRGGEVYRQHLDDRNVETLISRRFALYPMRPQIARRYGFRFAAHFGLDAGRFPIPRESKRLWESPDASHLESLTRPPIGADRAIEGARLAWRMARSMNDDHVATLILAHWPDAVAGWYRDFRRSATYSPVLARWVTLGDYFHMSDRPFEMLTPVLDDYATPYLAQAVSRGDDRPISRRVRHARARATLDGLIALDALRRAMTTPGRGLDDDTAEPIPTAEPGLDARALEIAIETDPVDLDAMTREVADRLARVVGGSDPEGRSGYLVFNPTGIPRRAAILLPEASLHLTPEPPLRAAQFADSGILGVVDLPGFGFAWVPGEPSPHAEAASAKSLVGGDGRTIRNETHEVEVDPLTGGLRAIRVRGDATARIGQQLVIAGLVDEDGKPVASRMVSESVQIHEAGPALARIESVGTIQHPEHDRPLVHFRQTVTLWAGRSTLEIAIHLSDFDGGWFDSIATADPWEKNLAVRWAWPDPAATLRRTSLLASEETRAERPETAECLDISTRRQRTSLVLGGLAHHRRRGPRMLDTILIAGREIERDFRLGVVLDLEHPAQAAVDFLAPALVVAHAGGCPQIGPTGWFAHVEGKAIAVVAVDFLDLQADGRGWGLSITVLETGGRPARGRIRLFRNPLFARQTDFQGELIMEIMAEGDAIPLDLTPHEMARFEVLFG